MTRTFMPAPVTCSVYSAIASLDRQVPNDLGLLLPTLLRERLHQLHICALTLRALGEVLEPARKAFVDLAGGMIGSEKAGDLAHLRDPAIGLWNHVRQRGLEPRQDR